jgi:hypothetical protein
MKNKHTLRRAKEMAMRFSQHAGHSGSEEGHRTRQRAANKKKRSRVVYFAGQGCVPLSKDLVLNHFPLLSPLVGWGDCSLSLVDTAEKVIGWVCEVRRFEIPKLLARPFTPSPHPFIPSAPTRRAPSLYYFPSATTHATSTYASSSPPSGRGSVSRSSLSVKSSGPNTGSGMRSAREQLSFVVIERDKVCGQ